MNNNNSSENLHIVCTSQVHTCGLTSDKQIDSVSDSLSASANYLRKLVLGDTKKPSTPEPSSDSENGDNPSKNGPDSTVSVHADSTFRDTLIGFTEYDSRDVNTEAYKAKRQAYDEVRQMYPDIDNLIRDEKVKALKSIRQVGFKYYSIQVTAFIKKDGLTRTVCSKSHHRLEMPSREYLEEILQKTFKGTLRPADKENSKGRADEDAAGGPPDA